MAKSAILKRADWPAHLRTSWEAGIRPSVLPRDPCGAGARWRRQTIETTEKSLGRFWQFSLEQGWDIADVPLTSLIAKERLQTYIAHLAERNAPATVLHRIVGLERGMTVIAPTSNRSLLRLIISDLDQYFEPTSKRERLQESAALIALGRKLMGQGMRYAKREPKQRAVTFRNGLSTALVAHRPLRLRNLSMMLIGRHLVKRGGIWHLQFAAHEVKNGKPIDVVFPEDLVEDLENYISIFRPILAGSKYTGNALWVSIDGTQMRPGSIRSALCKVTKDAFGLPITPQLFRDCAATSLAVHSPELIGVAHLILGNTYAVMEKHYNLARVIDAGRHFCDALGLG